MTVEIEGQVPRAYPVRYLIWHEIVNDIIGDMPVAVTFCPLCNSGLIFDRRLGNEQFSFGVSGKLRKSDMVMYDRETESWWQQFEGVAHCRRKDRRRSESGSWVGLKAGSISGHAIPGAWSW